MATTKPKKRKPPKRPDPYQGFWKIRAKYHVLTVENMKEAIIRYRGNLSAVCRSFKVSRDTVRMYVNAHRDELGETLDLARQTLCDKAEWNITEAVEDGNISASRFILDTFARDRGYGPQVQIGGPAQTNGALGPIPVQIFLPANGRELPGSPVQQQAAIADSLPLSPIEAADDGPAA